MLEAGHSVYSGLQNLCVWAKDNGGMGSFTGRSMSWYSSGRWVTRRT